MLKNLILNYVNKPVDNILSSQTLYEALLTAVNMYEAYHDQAYKKASYEIARLIIDTQLDDGGFDIGYNFSFGKNMKKQNLKESTTPEILSIYALIRFFDFYKEDFAIEPIRKGINWITTHSKKCDSKYWTIPYAPLSYKEVHITNGISFAVATLVFYMKVFNDDTVLEICDGMIEFMKDELIVSNCYGYWNYFEKKLMEDSYYIKIDNYHIAQQLYYHLLIDKHYDSKSNKQIIRLASTYLFNKLEKSLDIPYIESNGKKSKEIHTWGYCSILSCAILSNEDKLIEKVKEFICGKMWNESFFYPIIRADGTVVENEYFPRSDAWILHSLSEYLVIEDDERVKGIVDIGLTKLKGCNYIGLENHVLTLRKVIFSKIVILIKRIRNEMRNS